MGGSVAAGFSAKYPNLCASLSLLSTLGIKFKPGVNERMLNRKYFGEWEMSKEKKRLPNRQENEFFDKDAVSTHRYLIDKQIAMVKWQVKNTPGYLGALLSTYRYFPLRGMEELYTAIGRHPRKALIVCGDHDLVCPYRKCVKLLEESFPRGNIVDVLDCGHNSVFEKFEEVVRELLAFNKEVFDAVRNSNAAAAAAAAGLAQSP
jgi:pimeloyl-ACP methyl ester carboxylesterase